MITIFLCFLFVLCLFVAFLVIAFDHFRSGLAPAISTPDTALKTIYDQLIINNSDEVWEIGCGDARVISYCAGKKPKANFVGLENGIIMLIKAKWRTKRQKNVTIKFGNLKSAKPKSATKMYLYLLPEALQIVQPHIPKECRVVSLEFKLPKRTPTNTVKLPKHSKFAHRLYIYKF